MASPGLAGFLKSLKKVKPGQRFEDAITSEFINAIIDSIHCLARGENIDAGGTIFKRAMDARVSLFGRRGEGGGGGGGLSTHPFQVTALAPASEGQPPRLQVELESWLAAGVNEDAYQANGKFTITGIGSPFNFVPSEGGKFYVWLEADIAENGDVTITVEHGDEPWDESATLESDPVGGGEPAKYPLPFAFTTGTVEDPGYLAKAYRMIAYTEEASEENEDYGNRLTITTGSGEEAVAHQIIQCVTTHLILCERCIDGLTILYFAPESAPCLHPPPE